MYKFAFITNNRDNKILLNNGNDILNFNSRTNTASLLSDDLIFFNFIKINQLEIVKNINDIDENTIIFFSANHSISDETIEKVFSIKAKKYLFDFASNDIIYYRNTINTIEKNCNNKEYCFISKSLDFGQIKNGYYYDQQLTRMCKWLLNINQNGWNGVLFNSKLSSQTLNAFNLLDSWKSKENLLPSYKGMYLIGHARFHKINLLNHFYKKDLLKDFLWTSGGRYFDSDTGYVSYANLKEYETYEVLNMLPKKLDYGYEESELPLVAIGTTANWSFYMDTCFEIIAETEFYKKTAESETMMHHISEKTIKPLIINMPFIILNFPNTIKKLENNFGFNFKTNIEEFNHSYDSILDDNERLEYIKKHTENLLSFSKKELNDMKTQYRFQTKENVNILYEIFWRDSVKKIFDFINED